jgi:multimeric flavodoxin WrbA
MTKLAIIYHSGHGHTEHIARHVLEGARHVDGIEAHLIQAEDMGTRPNDLVDFDGIVLGSPTYLGGVSGPFKSFMDATGRLWAQQGLKGKLAAGFTVSSLPAGDKQSTLLSMFVFAMQHGCCGSAIPSCRSSTVGCRTTKPPTAWVRGPASWRKRATRHRPIRSSPAM